MAKAVKKTVKKESVTKKIEHILITQPKPQSDKSPYFDLEKKYNVKLDFHPFIQLEGLTAREFRKQKLDLNDFSAVILLSRNAVDHFFRICDEMKFKVPQDMRYFCITEAVALYLQKFILYRKRKVFFSADGSPDGLADVLQKYKDRARFIMPVSENTKNDLSAKLTDANYDYAEAVLYRTVGTEISGVLQNKYDVIVFFSPFSVDTLMNAVPAYQQDGTLIGAFGNNTSQAVEDAGLKLNIKAPEPDTPSMVAALIKTLEKTNK